MDDARRVTRSRRPRRATRCVASRRSIFRLLTFVVERVAHGDARRAMTRETTRETRDDDARDDARDDAPGARDDATTTTRRIFGRCDGGVACARARASATTRGETKTGCEREGQPYTNVETKTGRARTGTRKLCKPCLRRREKDRANAKRARETTSVNEDGGRGRASESKGAGDAMDDARIAAARRATGARAGGGGANLGRARRESVVLFGDSLTERSFEDGGFGARVQHEFRRFADVRCRGYSGYNTEHALCLLDEVFPLNEDVDDDGAFATYKRAPVLVTILFGSNDACAKNSSAGDVQHVPLPRYEQNLKTIVERVRRMQPSPRILFITPPPVDDEAWLRDCATRAAQPGLGFGSLLNDTAPNRTNAGVKPYAEAMKRVARFYDIPVVDLHAALEFSNGEVDETQFCDGLHFSEAGQRQVASLVIDALRQHFPALASRASDAVKCDFPDWKDLDARGFAAQISHHRDVVAPLLGAPNDP
jgi:lysophospholipase L1-like esterase